MVVRWSLCCIILLELAKCSVQYVCYVTVHIFCVYLITFLPICAFGQIFQLRIEYIFIYIQSMTNFKYSILAKSMHTSDGAMHSIIICSHIFLFWFQWSVHFNSPFTGGYCPLLDSCTVVSKWWKRTRAHNKFAVLKLPARWMLICVATCSKQLITAEQFQQTPGKLSTKNIMCMISIEKTN